MLHFSKNYYSFTISSWQSTSNGSQILSTRGCRSTQCLTLCCYSGLLHSPPQPVAPPSLSACDLIPFTQEMEAISSLWVIPCTSPKHPLSCIEHRLMLHFYTIVHMFRCHSPKSSHPLPLGFEWLQNVYEFKALKIVKRKILSHFRCKIDVWLRT